MNDTQRLIISVLGAIALAATLVACGFAVCAGFPQVTELIAEQTSNEELSPFSREELVDAAVATRAYTIETGDREALMGTIAAINDAAQTPYAGATVEELAAAPDAYTLTPEEIAHLDDVNSVVHRVLPALFGVVVLTVFCLLVVLRTCGPRAFGKPLAWAGGAVIALFVILASWALIDFNGLFAAFHVLFFAAGTWTFPSDSLLICMYPQGFWSGMGVVWLAVTLALSVCALVCGLFFIRRGGAASKMQRMADIRKNLVVENWLDDEDDEEETSSTVIENWLDDEEENEKAPGGDADATTVAASAPARAEAGGSGTEAKPGSPKTGTSDPADADTTRTTASDKR